MEHSEAVSREPVTSQGRTCHQPVTSKTPLSPNVYRPPVTLSPPVTPGVPFLLLIVILILILPPPTDIAENWVHLWSFIIRSCRQNSRGQPSHHFLISGFASIGVISGVHSF